MRKIHHMLTIVAIFFGSVRGMALTAQHVCADVAIRSTKSIAFTDTEKDLICDDAQAKPWSLIPYWQRVYFLTVFLQARGYFFAQFSPDGNRVVADAGPLVVAKSINLRRNPLGLDAHRYWQIYNQPLTTDLLNQLETLILHDYAKAGFPCAAAQIQAYPAENMITVDINTGDRISFPAIVGGPIPGQLPGLERRYDAFETGAIFDPMLLDLTSRRIINDQLVVTTNFTTRCTHPGFRVYQYFIPGKPNLINLGIGFDTEEYLIGEAGFRNGRLLETASSLEGFAHASYRLFLLRAGFNWYYAHRVTRHYIKTSLSFNRQNEKDFDSRSTDLKVGPFVYRDVDALALSLWLAPTVRRIIVTRGGGPATTNSLALTLSASAMTHDFEYYASNPRSGFGVNIDLAGESKAMGSAISVSSYTLSMTHLWSLFNYAPPISILGIRVKLAATAPGGDTKADEIPANFKHRLGGSSDIRGFARGSIPPQGSLLFAYTGMELRMNHLLPFGLQPVTFLDVGKIGDSAADMGATTYWSPGWGIHWQTPVGVIRATMAYGLVNGKMSTEWHHREGWQFYLSLGEQF